MTAHVRGTVNELGYDRGICVQCEVTWPCVDSVKEACERLDLANGLPCNCGWHEATEEKLAQDPEQEKVMERAALGDTGRHPTCENCRGDGDVCVRRGTTSDDDEYVICPDCDGSGSAAFPSENNPPADAVASDEKDRS